MSDETVEEKLQELYDAFEKINEAELYISAESHEEYSYGPWHDDWIWGYDDKVGIGGIIEDAVRFARDCMNDCRYEEAVTIINRVMEVSVTVIDENMGDSFELSFEQMVEENLVYISLKELALNVLYSEYRLQPMDKRPEILYEYFQYPYFKDIHIEDIFSVGREELTDTDAFLQSWIDYLMLQNGEPSTRLLKEAALYLYGSDGLVEIARKCYTKHPSTYLDALLEYEKEHGFEKMIKIG